MAEDGSITHDHSGQLSMDELNGFELDDFVGALGEVFENSPWVAQTVWTNRPFPSVEELHRQMMEAVHSAPHERQVAFLNLHPELGGKDPVAERLTRDSAREQGGAGLTALTADEAAELAELNAAYRQAHGYPFILAVNGLDKYAVLQELRRRSRTDSDLEFRGALAEISRITRMRLGRLLEA
jgi:2-oxo-4-hydroxy-4-carboxy-5-ureidoimidazoline decarboxylase